MNQHSIPGTRRLAVSVLAGLMALPALWPASQARAQTGAPGPLPFEFLNGRSDEVAIAMASIWNAQFAVPADPDVAAEALQARVDAEAVVRGGSDIAGAHLMEALRTLSENDAAGLASLGPLLRLVGEQQEILSHFQVILMQDAPPPGAAVGGAEAAIPPARLFRSTALAHVVRTADAGSDLASEQLLELLGSRDPAIRSGAVQGFYRTRSSRRSAQREMRRHLDLDEQYLLYRH